MNALRINSIREQFLSGGRHVSPHSPAPMTRAFEDDHDDHQHSKKSVLAKVKEKALKWRHAIAKKKHGHDKGSTTPAWGVCLDEEDDDEQDHEYHGTQMFESETDPDVYKQRAARRQITTHTGSEERKTHHYPSGQQVRKHVNEFAPQHLVELLETASAGTRKTLVAGTLPFRKAMHDDLDDEEAGCMTPPASPVRVLKPLMGTKAIESKPINAMNKSASNNALTEAVAQVIAPAYNMASEATQAIASKIQRPTADEELGAKMKHDNKMKYDGGVSVKEYVLRKLEPGEDDRALSEVITETISPRKSKNAGEKSVADKVREAVYALLLRGGETETPIPVITNPRAVDIEEADRKKLACAN